MWLTYFEDVVTTCCVTDNLCGSCNIITLNRMWGFMGTICLCLRSASVCLCTCLCGPFHFQALCYQSCCSVFSRDEKCVAKTRATLLTMLYVVYVMLKLANNVFQELLPARGCQIHWHCCPVSQAISSPSVTVNAFSDTAPLFKVTDMCCFAEEEAIWPLVMCFKSESTPAGICSLSSTVKAFP